MSDPKKSPFFSIILPTLGKVNQWSEAINSVRAQTYADWELIAIDSGAESLSRPLVEKLNDKRIIYVNTSKGNPRLNWDTGYRHAEGQYLIWLDDDNYLLPHALNTLAQVIKDKGYPDMVTAEHMHYRGLQHYISSYHNQLVVPQPLFTGTVYPIDPRDIIRRLMGWPQKTDARARFHMSETAVRRPIADELLRHLGEINFETTSTHALRVGVLALSKTIYGIDAPVALVGQIGHALSFTWPRIDSPVLKKVKYNLSLSPLSAITYANYRLENMLRTKDRLGPVLADTEVNLPVFVATYRRELLAFSQTWGEWFRHWRELSRFLKNQTEPEFVRLRKDQYVFILKGFAVQCVRKLGLYSVLQKLFSKERVSDKNGRAIPVQQYGVVGMTSCAAQLPAIVQKELNIPYEDFIAVH